MDKTWITDLTWGDIEVNIDGKKRHFKDCKVWPGGAREWRWEEMGTHHTPGVQPADIKEILEHDIEVVVIGRGQLRRLNVSIETERLLFEREIPLHAKSTKKAVQLFNKLVEQGKRVGGLFHSTC